MPSNLVAQKERSVTQPRRRTRVWKWFVGTWQPLIMLLFDWRLGWLMDWPWRCSEDEFLEWASTLRGVVFRPQKS